VPKGDKRPERVENKSRANKTVDVEFAQILDRRDPSLVRAVYVLLKATSNVLQHLVDHSDREFGVVPLQVICEHCEQSDVAKTEFVRFGKDFVQYATCVGVVPIKLTQKLKYLVDCAFGEDVVQEVANEEFDGASLLLLARSAFRWIGLDDDEYRFRLHELHTLDSRHSQATWSDVDQYGEDSACAS
jgi:transglutaminase-like putative cysteine protease